MGDKLKLGIILGSKREGNCTPSPTWTFGLIQSDGTLTQDFNSCAESKTLSARKLGANLWEMQQQPLFQLGVTAKVTKKRPNLNHQNDMGKLSGVPKEMDEAPAEGPSEQIPQHRPAIAQNSSLSSKGRFRESGHGLKTTTKLLELLNRIWSLEEKHALDMSSLKRELEVSQAQIKELLQEKKHHEMAVDIITKQLRECKVALKKEQDSMKDAVKLAEDERKSRRHSEKLYQQLTEEHSEMKSSFSNALRELDRERKARRLLESLCDEFAKGLRDYHQELRLLKHKSGRDQLQMEDDDGLILHICEAWLDERMQMKLRNAHDISQKESVMDKLSFEIEAFLLAKQSVDYGKNGGVSSTKPTESNILPHSSESFHLNEPASDPWKGNEEQASVSIDNRNQESTKSRPENLCPRNNLRMPEGSGPSEISPADPDISGSPSRWPQSLKYPTLREKLMEARLERQRARLSKHLSPR